MSFDRLNPDPGLAAAINALPGRKIVYTNGTAPYAENVLAARGLATQFDAVYGVEHADYHPKPSAAAFETISGRVDRLDFLFNNAAVYPKGEGGLERLDTAEIARAFQVNTLAPIEVVRTFLPWT